MILKCSCKHAYQDELYGSGKRVHNRCAKDRIVKYRCTVCDSTKETGMNYE